MAETEIKVTYLTGEVPFQQPTYHIESRILSLGTRWSWKEWSFVPKFEVEFGIVPDDKGLVSLWGFETFSEAADMMKEARMPFVRGNNAVSWMMITREMSIAELLETFPSSPELK